MWPILYWIILQALAYIFIPKITSIIMPAEPNRHQIAWDYNQYKIASMKPKRLNVAVSSQRSLWPIVLKKWTQLESLL